MSQVHDVKNQTGINDIPVQVGATGGAEATAPPPPPPVGRSCQC